MIPSSNKAKTQDFCRYLKWDSEFFGVNIAQISGTTLNNNELIDVFKWSRKNKINCIYYMVDPSCQTANYNAMDNQFYFVDIRVTLAIDLGEKMDVLHNADSCVVRSSKESDIPLLREIACVSHTDTRFYFDPKFPNSLCDKFYERWVENSCKDFADVVLVAELGRKVVGYISCHLDDLNTGKIGLIAVKSDAQGLGIGTVLVNSALEWFSKNKVDRISVITQGRNITAQKLYQKCGFKSYSTMIWYHKWFH